MEKGSLDFKKIYLNPHSKKKKNGSFKHSSLKDSLGTKIGVSVASLWKPHYKTFIFKYG